MLILLCASILAAASALPTPQILAPAAALTAIPATNHILILTPQAQVQLEPSLKYPQPIVQHLAPVARIDSPTDQTVVYYPNENLINNAFQKSELKPKQLETTNLTNIVNQFVSAGQTAQAQLEAFQQQLTQGLEGLIQPVGGQKIEGEKDTILKEPIESAVSASKLIETARHESGRYYSVPGAPQFYSNFELIHSPVNPLYAIHPYTAVRARSVVLPDEKLLNAKLPDAKLPDAKLPDAKLSDAKLSDAKLPEEKLPEKGALIALENAGEIKLEKESASIQTEAQKNIEARSIDGAKTPEEKSHSEALNTHSEHEIVSDNSHFGKYLGSLEKNLGESKKEEELIENIRKDDDKKDSELLSYAEAQPSGLAISGEGGLSQAKPIASAIVGKDGVAFSAPSGTAIAGSSDDKDN